MSISDANKARIIDRVGMTFGIQVVESFSHHDGKMNYWTVLCGCGSRRAVSGGTLSKGTGKSCGCLTREILSKARTTHGQSTGSGRPGTLAYRCWASMHERCTLTCRKDWMSYGGRGIKVCDQWKTFEQFYADMGDAPKGWSLDRIDHNGNYEPSNCRWASAKMQANNRRNNRVVTHEGLTLTASQWAEAIGVKVSTFCRRLNRMSIDRVFNSCDMRSIRLPNSPRAAK